MKSNRIATLLAVCGLAINVSRAQEPQDKPAPPKPPEAAPKPTEPPREGRADKPRGDGERREGEPVRRPRDLERNEFNRRAPKPETKLTSFIGVLTRPLSDDVRAQTGLSDGFGLLVEEVMPDSPAQKAGLQQHDVLVLLGDQRLVNQEQLAALVRAEKKDSDITFTIKRAGVEQKITVRVGEKMMPVAMERDERHPGGFPYGGIWGDRDSVERFQQQMRQGTEQFQRGMREFQERMKDWSRGPKDGPSPQSPRFDGNRRDGDRRGPDAPRHEPDRRDNNRGPRDDGRPPEMKREPQGDRSPPPPGDSVKRSSRDFQRNVVRRDDEGEYSLSDNNGAKVFSVKPVHGEDQTFIVNTEEQRQAVPERYRAKLRELEGVDRRMKPDAPVPQPQGGRDKPGGGI